MVLCHEETKVHFQHEMIEVSSLNPRVATSFKSYVEFVSA